MQTHVYFLMDYNKSRRLKQWLVLWKEMKSEHSSHNYQWFFSAACHLWITWHKTAVRSLCCKDMTALPGTASQFVVCSLTEFTYYMLQLTKPTRKGNYLSPAAGPGMAILWIGSGPSRKHRPPCCGVPSVAWFLTTAVGLFALFCFDIISIFQKNYTINASNSKKLGSICLHFYLHFRIICFIILSLV